MKFGFFWRYLFWFYQRVLFPWAILLFKLLGKNIDNIRRNQATVFLFGGIKFLRLWPVPRLYKDSICSIYQADATTHTDLMT